MHGGDEKCIQHYNRKTEREIDHLQDLGIDGITIYNWIYKAKCKGVDWINLAQDTAQCRARENGDEPWCYIKPEKFLTSWVTISFSRRTLLH
jgi:hypothetical protein